MVVAAETSNPAAAMASVGMLLVNVLSANQVLEKRRAEAADRGQHPTRGHDAAGVGE